MLTDLHPVFPKCSMNDVDFIWCQVDFKNRYQANLSLEGILKLSVPPLRRHRFRLPPA